MLVLWYVQSSPEVVLDNVRASCRPDEQALFLAQTDSDTTGKSYYGETNLYSLSLDGSFDGMVDLGELSCADRYASRVLS